MKERQYAELDSSIEHKLKEKTAEELFGMLLDVAAEWEPEQQAQLVFAYELVSRAHENDRHKDKPYVYHLLRVANRTTQYLHIKDPDVVIAALLHDIVEDHALEIIDGSLFNDDRKPFPTLEVMREQSPREQQQIALQHIEALFSPGVAEIVSAVTNPPRENKPTDYYEKLRAYVAKVESAIVGPRVWAVKFCDWCDNGLGVVHDRAGQGDKSFHFELKYGYVQPVLEARFYQPDIQAMLDEPAKAYVRRQFDLGRKRLNVQAL